MVSCWAILKSITFYVKLVLLLGNLWTELGCFLFQHLATLTV